MKHAPPNPLAILVLALSMVMGCGIGFDGASGDDAQRGDAPEATVDQYIDDRVSASEGDHSDWRMFVLEQPSRVTVEIWWDNPDVDGTLMVRGRRSGSAKEREHEDGRRHEKLGPINLEDGQWYVRVQATSGSSSYTMRIVTGESTGGGGGLPDF